MKLIMILWIEDEFDDNFAFEVSIFSLFLEREENRCFNVQESWIQTGVLVKPPLKMDW